MGSDANLLKVRRDIDRRNKTDMRFYPTMVFAVLVVYGFVAFYRGLFFETDAEIPTFSILVVGSGLGLAMMYVMATRVNKHNKRDAELMTDLCEYLKQRVQGGERNENIIEIRECTPKDVTKQSALFIFFFATLFPAAFGALIYAMGLTTDADYVAFRLILVSLGLGLLVILININYPRFHEKRFIRFSAATVAAFESLGVHMDGYREVVGKRNLYLLILLSVVTLGIFLVVWLCISMRDFNRHISEQWNFENRLMDAMILLGAETLPMVQLSDIEEDRNFP